MDVRELTRDQLIELKQYYMDELVNEGSFAEVMGVDYDEPPYGDLASADNIIPDALMFEHYDGIDFVNDDFLCTAGL